MHGSLANGDVQSAVLVVVPLEWVVDLDGVLQRFTVKKTSVLQKDEV